MITSQEAREKVKNYNNRMDYTVIGNALNKIEHCIESRANKGKKYIILRDLCDDKQDFPHKREWEFIIDELKNAGYKIQYVEPNTDFDGLYNNSDIKVSWQFLMTNKIETDGTDILICPYCGFEEPDSWELWEADDNYECSNCGKIFEYDSITVRYFYSYPKEQDDEDR